MLFFSFSKKYRPFEHLKCHECLWCKFFDDCKSEFDYAKSFDTDDKPLYFVDMLFIRNKNEERETVTGEPIEWLKTHKDDTYGKSVK